MKKALFYAAVLIALILIINIGSIVLTDFDRLTEYGYGYLVGKILLFVVFVFIAYFLRPLPESKG